MDRNRVSLFAAAILFIAVAHLDARVISYAPYTDRTAYPAHQNRTNRHFALVEVPAFSPNSPLPSATYGQLVVYDFEGVDEPRVVFPQDETSTIFIAAAVYEVAGAAPTFFIQVSSNSGQYSSLLSNDGGTTWKSLSLPSAPITQVAVTGSDNGGPFASYRYSQVRVGSAEFPFVVAAGNAVYAIASGGTTRKIYEQPLANPPAIALAGRDRTGTKFLVRTSSQLITVDLQGGTQPVLSSFIGQVPYFEGFIASDGSVYVEERANNSATAKIWYVHNGVKSELFDVRWIDTATPSAFAIPASDYSGAWIVERGGGRPTSLYRHSAGADLQKMWEDITAPDLEALHAGSSGTELLIQVHRPRPAVDARIFKDPALAVWHVGDPAPRAYDELFMNEQWNKGFVHVDADKIRSGEPFVFDSGAAPTGGGGIIFSPGVPPSSGGSDVAQEWGVVRASLKQRLILPTVGRTRGAYGSDWRSDVIIQNPLDVPQSVTFRFVPSGDVIAAWLNEVSITLEPRQIRMISDIAASLFRIESGIGALFITPESAVTVTSRTYSRAGEGSYGFSMNAVDVLAAAASSRFPVSFAGAFLGANFRTNVTITDTSGRGTEALLTASGIDGAIGISNLPLTIAANGHQQVSFIGGSLGLMPYETGALVVRPSRGSAITAVFAIDNRTNDSTYFAPDLPASFTPRVIPAIGHLDGGSGSRFRTDLYLFNPTDQPRSVLLEAKAWDVPEAPSSLFLTLLPKEARVIRDVLLNAFGKTGIARLRYSSQTPGGGGVRVTSRTYNVDSNGGTYGFLMPPLNNFQIGGSGDTLEILGAFADPRYRTNIGLVEMTPWPTNQNATARIEILDSSSKSIDSFTVNLPVAGGTQLNDVFRARSLNVSGPVLIRVTPTSGTIGAYATTTDNVTNDSSYLAANLAAKE